MNKQELNKPLAPQPPTVLPLSRLDSPTLFAGRRELVIVHNGQEYRLRITSQQKLILTK